MSLSGRQGVFLREDNACELRDATGCCGAALRCRQEPGLFLALLPSMQVLVNAVCASILLCTSNVRRHATQPSGHTNATLHPANPLLSAADAAR